MLTKTQIEQYREEGFVLVEGVLDEITRKHMKQVVADLVEKSRAVTAHDGVFDLEPGHSRAEPRVRSFGVALGVELAFGGAKFQGL